MRLPTLFLIPFLALPAFAQDEEVPAIQGLGVPAPVAAEPAPAGKGQLGDTLIVEAIEQLKLSGNDLAALYRKYTGRRVIVASAAAQAEFQFIQPASPRDPLTYAQAAELLKKAATIGNFVFVPDPSDPNLDILTPAPAGPKPAGRGVAVFTENDPLPEGDAVISYVMKLSFIKPDEAVRTFTRIIDQFGAFGSIAAVPNAASVTITEKTSLIRRLIDLKAQIDKPSSQVATRFITVKHADVTELAATLNERLGEAPPDQKDTPVQITPDPRTNRIFAMGRPVDLLFVEGLVQKFDTEPD